MLKIKTSFSNVGRWQQWNNIMEGSGKNYGRKIGRALWIRCEINSQLSGLKPKFLNYFWGIL